MTWVELFVKLFPTSTVITTNEFHLPFIHEPQTHTCLIHIVNFPYYANPKTYLYIVHSPYGSKATTT